MSDEDFMRAALEQARMAGACDEVPVGAVVVRADAIVARAANRTITDLDPTAHAEARALRAAGQEIRDWRLGGCTLYVTLEPCAMCAGAIVLARLDRLVFGAWDEKAGMVGSLGDIVRHPKLNHRAEVKAGVLEHECGAVLREFFAAKR